MNLDEVKLTLENERKFHDEYHRCRNRSADGTNPGSSCSVQRRSVIAYAVRNYCNDRVAMCDTIELEKYFNERYELCPYGLSSGKVTKQQPAAPVEQIEQSPPQEEKIMSQSITKIETKTFVNGVEAAKLSDEDIFEIIRSTEDEIKGLEAISNKPKKLQAKIDAMNASIVGLVALVDAR